MNRPRLLDLFCGEGGAAWGYDQAGFHVTGVDNSEARLSRYPFNFYYADALAVLANRQVTDLFDVIHASPPCQGYSRGTVALPDRLNKYDRFISVVRDLLEATGKPYVIENVFGS